MGNRNSSQSSLLEEIRRIHHQMPRWVILIIGVAVFIFFAYHTAGLLMIILLSVIVSFLLNMPVKRAETAGIRRDVSIIALYCLAAFLLLLVHQLFVPSLQRELLNFYDSLPKLSNELNAIMHREAEKSHGSASLFDRAAQKILSGFARPGEFVSRTLNLSDMFNQAATFLLGIILTPFFVFFMLKDWPNFSKKLMDLIPGAYVETTVSLFCEINILVGNYLRGLALDCLAIGTIATVGLWLMGVNYPITLGILTGIANIVPYFGPMTAAASSALIVLIQFKKFAAVVNVLIFFLCLRLIDDLVIQPVTLGKSVKIPPMLLVITIISGEKLFGVMGMVLAVPVVTIVQKVLSILIESRKPIATRKKPEKTREYAIPV